MHGPGLDAWLAKLAGMHFGYSVVVEGGGWKVLA